MKIFVKVKPNSKKESIDIIDDNHFVLKVAEAPIEDRANIGAARMLARHFNIPISAVKLIKGARSRNKIFACEKRSLAPQLRGSRNANAPMRIIKSERR